MREDIEKQIYEGICLILPKHESIDWSKKLGVFMLVASVSIDRFGVGFQILKAGILIEIGPFYLGICHIKKQSDFYKTNHH